MPQTATDEFNDLIGELIRRESTNQLAAYRPYPFQKDWHNAKGLNTDQPARQKALMCANKVGKTFCGAYENAYHMTGLYPPWWEGECFKNPVKILMAGESVDMVRDALQSELMGDPHDPDALGTAAIPRDLIVGKPVYKQGYKDAMDSIAVRHVPTGGVSRCKFQAYEQGPKKFYAKGYHVVHFDEEPPLPIYSQGLRAVIATKGIINLTFTSEEGVTEVVDGFMNELKTGQALVGATWDDAPHIRDDPQHRQQLLEAIPYHEREMRSKGVPKMGSGLIYPINDERISVKPFEIPPWWPRICGIDFGGSDHPFAAAWIAIDRDTHTAYVYKTYKNMGAFPIHCDALRRQECDWIPVAWPHDVGQADHNSGRPLASIMRDDYGLNMLLKSFSNEPSPGQKEGEGGMGVEVGLWSIQTAMETGRFKVFETEADWFREKSLYHRKDGKIVKRMDDLMDGTRYGYQSERFADIKPRPMNHKIQMPEGLRNW